ncbi:MAG: hypothetical protein KF716_05635 [Anaerolineae bacterium]|nr:hypothetical protein [Anaerolineae bacterium]
MAAIERELVEEIRKMNADQQRKVLEFARTLTNQNVDNDWESQPWTDEELQEMMTPRRKTMKEVMAWLDANPPTEEWGGMKPEDDPAEFIHNLRSQRSTVLPDPGAIE